jgi:hypothetical protein
MSWLDQPVFMVVAPLHDSGILPYSLVDKLVTMLETLSSDHFC